MLIWFLTDGNKANYFSPGGTVPLNFYKQNLSEFDFLQNVLLILWTSVIQAQVPQTF